MTYLIIIFAGSASFALGILSLREQAYQKKVLLQVLYATFLLFAFSLLLAEFIGFNFHPLLLLAAFTFLSCFFVLRIMSSQFWGKIWHYFWLVILFIFVGYLYTFHQLPYTDIPYRLFSSNQPKSIQLDQLSYRTITGLPENSEFHQPLKNAKSAQTIPDTPETNQNQHHNLLKWSELEQIMSQDSHIRYILLSLKEQQLKALSGFLSDLNSKSVADTQMPRHLLSKKRIKNLYKERAISRARYQTLLETWKLLDKQENAFHLQQSEQRQHTLFALLEDEKIDESNQVTLIQFMTKKFQQDLRLIKPLIRLYEQLDREYPRQKRLNHSFMDLYLKKRQALLDGFKAIGRPALQPLLDYRYKTISSIHYSQARLDNFIEQVFNVKVQSLYQAAAPGSIPDLLNREKYPDLRLLRGPSFKQEFIRKELLMVAEENTPPVKGQAIMGLQQTSYNDMRKVVETGYSDQLDYFMIDNNPAVRGNLAWLLAELKKPLALPIIFELMQDFDPEVRRIAAIAAGAFEIVDMPGANDQKFVEIIRMLQNYRSNSDVFGRIWALYALTAGGDSQKALYILDLILNNGAAAHSVLGVASPTWRSQEEQNIVNSLIKTLQQTPEELAVKTAALNAILALDSPESLAVLLHYLSNVYHQYHERPSIWRFILPHMSLPQEAENIEDLIIYMATKYGQEKQPNKRQLKALQRAIRIAYEQNHSGQFFQYLMFLQAFDNSEFQRFVKHNKDQIQIMRLWEYYLAGHNFWLFFIPISALLLVFFIYVILPKFNLNLGIQGGKHANKRASPAADRNNKILAPASSIIPIQISHDGSYQK